MSIRALSDGKVLIHCFAGCTTGEIVQAMDLRLIDLFPMREERHRSRGPYRSQATRWQGPSASQALAALAFEAQFVAIVANDLAAGKELEEDDRARLWTAVGRIGQAKGLCCG